MNLKTGRSACSAMAGKRVAPHSRCGKGRPGRPEIPEGIVLAR